MIRNVSAACLLYFSLSILIVSSAAARYDGQFDIASGTFSGESHPRDDQQVLKQDLNAINVRSGNWLAFKQFDFGPSASYVWIEVASAKAGGGIELRVGKPTGTLIGTIPVPTTGGQEIYKPVGLKLPRPVNGVHDLYLTVVGNANDSWNLARFRFQRLAPDYKTVRVDPVSQSSMIEPNYTNAGSFTVESNPDDNNKVRSDGGKVNYIEDGTWVGYKDFEFGKESRYFSVEASSQSENSKLELRLSRPDGPKIGEVLIKSTGDFKTFRSFGTTLSRPVKGTHDLYLKFEGPGGYLFDLQSFLFDSIPPGQKSTGSRCLAAQFEKESHPDSEPVVIKNEEVQSLQQGSWIAFANFDFGINTNRISIEAATPDNGGTIEIRTQTASGPLIGTVNVSHTGSWTHFRPFTAKLARPISGRHHLFLKFIGPSDSNDELFRLRSFEFESDPSSPQASTSNSSTSLGDQKLQVYPPVPGLDPSPYYKFSVQRLDALNATKMQDVTNWQHPFAWMTRCVDRVEGKETAYYEEFIGSWSHTYCNFETDSNLPIVIKIQRLDKQGAPSGPITMANPHPAHKVESCEIIDGDVYVTMKNPALVAIDIDGQMDTRDAPRAIPNQWGDKPFPYRNEMNGCHGVTIFANPFIKDKPKPTDPDVLVVQPGTRPPSDGDWKTLYFLPGVHKLSVDEAGNEREWTPSDPIFLRNHKSYYIPGDAIVYGNLNDLNDDQESVNIRVFGHGTISGSKIPHWKDFSFGELPGENHKSLRMLQLTRASNCFYEGITIADPAEHGAYIEGYGYLHAANKISWFKNLSWRVNNDGGGVTGNGTVEDCFFRHQDDAMYVRGVAIRRCVLWSDVNGAPLRCSFITNDRNSDYPRFLPADLIVEDCDVIYSRGVFAFDDATSFGVITTPGSFDSQKTYSDGTVNTGQHLLFRDIRVTDPRPVRYLLGFDATGDENDPQKSPWAGLRFENVEFRHPHTWGWKNRLIGSEQAPIHHWSFDQVSIHGQPLDSRLLNDPKVFETKHVSEMKFSPRVSKSQ
jgi:hypothetical protein